MTKRGILRAGLWALAVVVLFVGAAAGFALCLRHKFNPAPPSNDFPKPANALEAQQQDIEQFSRLLAMDRAFSPAARAEANRQIAELKSEQAPLDRERFVRRCTGGPKDPNYRWNSFGAVSPTCAAQMELPTSCRYISALCVPFVLR
jgi:hypothetical protein